MKTASRRQSNLCPSPAVKYITCSISSESYHSIENEIENSMPDSSDCGCGISEVHSHECGLTNRKPSPEMCIGGCKQHSVKKSDYHSEKGNGSAYECSGECTNEGRMLSLSLCSDNGLFCGSTSLICMTGLHTCGDLTVDAIRLFFQLASVKLLILVPCCYHKMSLSKDTSVTQEKFSNFPLSSSLCQLIHSTAFCDSLSFLRRPFLRLASQETPARWQQWSEEDHKQHSVQVMARAVLELYAHNGMQAFFCYCGIYCKKIPMKTHCWPSARPN